MTNLQFYGRSVVAINNDCTSTSRERVFHYESFFSRHYVLQIPSISTLYSVLTGGRCYGNTSVRLDFEDPFQLELDAKSFKALWHGRKIGP
jgi:hypothetical protein